MIRATVKVFQDFPLVTAEIEYRTLQALNQAAEDGGAVANLQAGNIGGVKTIPAHTTAEGAVSGIKFDNWLWRIFDKGSLGKHVGKLQRNRQESWTVTRNGNPYVAYRGDVTGEGVDPRNISNPARAAGKKALIAGIHSH